MTLLFLCIYTLASMLALQGTNPMSESLSQAEPGSEVLFDQVVNDIEPLIHPTCAADIYGALIELLDLVIDAGERKQLDSEELLFMQQMRRTLRHRLMSILPLKAVCHKQLHQST